MVLNTGFEDQDDQDAIGDDGMSVIYFDPTTVLYVSLFLILFAFFAALNTRSDERSVLANDVMLSLGQSFGGGSALTIEEGPASAANGDRAGAGLVGRTEALVSEVFPGADVMRSGNRLETSLFLDGFFIGRQVKIAPSRELFIKRLVEAMTGEGRSSVLELGVGSETFKSSKAQRRMALLAQTAQKYGLPASQIRIVSLDEASSRLHLVVEVRS